MLAWLIITLWAAGCAVTSPLWLRWWMLRSVCTRCIHRSCFDDCDCSCLRYPKAPRGALRERRSGDVAVALVLGGQWPAIGLGLLVYRAARLLWSVLRWSVLTATPLTLPELRRRERERADEIEHLTRELAPIQPSGYVASWPPSLSQPHPGDDLTVWRG